MTKKKTKPVKKAEPVFQHSEDFILMNEFKNHVVEASMRLAVAQIGELGVGLEDLDLVFISSKANELIAAAHDAVDLDVDYLGDTPTEEVFSDDDVASKE